MADRGALGKQTSRYIYNWCNQGCNVLPWRCLPVAWLLTKLLFLVNVVTQMFFLNRYLRTFDPPLDFSSSYGDVIMDNLFTNNGYLWKMSPVFPRNVLCNFEILQMNNLHRYTVQCDLPMNEYSEVAFIVLWVWFVFVAVVTCVSFVVWLVQVAVPEFRQRYIRKMLRMSEEFAHVTSKETDGFAGWIGEDGVMALKLIGSNSSELVVSDVVCNMWRRRQVEMGTSTTGSVPLQQQQHHQQQQSILQTHNPRTNQTTHIQMPKDADLKGHVEASGGDPLYPDIAMEAKLQ